jgi:hypothetical protein
MKVTIDSLVEGFKAKMDNPYYLFSDKKATITNYYSQNIYLSTLDQASKLQYESIGSNSPLKYSLVKDMLIYGIERIVTELENGDFGLEANTIEGEGIILPNTIIPMAEDYFTITYLNQNVLFKVISITSDTLENDSNFYKISYKLDKITTDDIDLQVVDNYNMIVNNVGTRFNTIIRSNDYNFIEKVESILDRLKSYYTTLFYSKWVQTLIFSLEGDLFYDPYMIEFLVRNNVLSNNHDFLFITHQTNIPNTFAVNYDKTFFRAVELKEIKTPLPKTQSQGFFINEPLSILSSRKEDYFRIEYNGLISNPLKPFIDNFDSTLIDNIVNNVLYTEQQSLYLNIIVKYFNNTEITGDDIYNLDVLDYESSMSLFYNIPIIIYIIEYIIRNILKK